MTIGKMMNYAEEMRAQVMPRNETEKKMYEALGSANWGASVSLMGEIAQDTFDYEKYAIVMKMVR